MTEAGSVVVEHIRGRFNDLQVLPNVCKQAAQPLHPHAMFCKALPDGDNRIIERHIINDEPNRLLATIASLAVLFHLHPLLRTNSTGTSMRIVVGTSLQS